MLINTKYLKKLTFLRYAAFATLKKYKICFPQNFNKNELKSILAKFHDLIINLRYTVSQEYLPHTGRMEKKKDETIRLAAKSCKPLTDSFGWKNLNRK